MSSPLTICPPQHGLNLSVSNTEAISSVITDAEEDQWKRELALVNKAEVQKNLTETLSRLQTVEKPTSLSQILETPIDELSPTVADFHTLSKAYHKKLRQLEKHLLGLLDENRKKQHIILTSIKDKKDMNCSYRKKFTVKCARIPYFKDFQGFPASPNEDAQEKRQKKELLPTDLIVVRHTWTADDNKALKAAILSNVIMNKLNSLERKKSALKNKSDEDTISKLKELNEEIEKTKLLNLNKAVADISPHELDWLKISVDLGHKFSDVECEAKWMLNLSPTINKSKWNESELKQLKSIAHEHKTQDWDTIAMKLGNNRTALQCCLKYQTKFAYNRNKWTPEEDAQLIHTVENCRLGDAVYWPKVAWSMPARTLKQCSERYLYKLDKNIVRGAFTMDEDNMILHAAKKFSCDFRIVVQFLPGRTPPQVRSRYEYLVGMMMARFSTAEDKLLADLYIQHGPKWNIIASHFSDRSVLQCRKRWEVLKKSAPLGTFIFEDDDSYEENDKDLDVLKRSNITSGMVEQFNRVSNNLYYRAGRPRKVEKEKAKYVKNTRNSYPLQQLLRYESTCCDYLFGPFFKPFSTDYQLENSLTNTKLALKSLSAEVNMSHRRGLIRANKDDLHMNQVRVLVNCIRESEGKSDFTGLFNHKNTNSSLVPPNYNTMVGLKSLLKGKEVIKHFSTHVCDVPYKRSPVVFPEDRLLFTDAQRLWRERLRCLFSYPWILSFFSFPVLATKRQCNKIKLTKKKLRENSRVLNKMRYMKQDNPYITKEEVIDIMNMEKSFVKTEPKVSRKRGRPKARPHVERVVVDDIGIDISVTGSETKKAKMITVTSSEAKRKRGRPRKSTKI